MFLFVYGNLMNGMKYHDKIKHCKFVENGRTQDKFYMTSLTCNSYPIVSPEKMNPNHSPNHIKGEIYEIDNQTLKKLDEFESLFNCYTRVKIPIIIESNDKFELTAEAYCYIVNQPSIFDDFKKFFQYTSQIVNEGDWKSFFQSSNINKQKIE